MTEIDKTTEMAECYAAFVKEADDRHAEFLKTGMAVGWEEMKAYARARAAGEDVPRPRARRILRPS